MERHIDLHIHTSASDGSLSPVEVVALAATKGLDCIAITDHDSIEGIRPALLEAEKHGLEVIPGIELSTDVDNGEVHILGYFIDVGNRELQDVLATARDDRQQRARRIVHMLEQLGCCIPWTRVTELAGDGSVGRGHIAQVLVEAGYVTSTAEAFEKYLGQTCPAYVRRHHRLKPTDAVKLIVHAGGLPVLAHPVTYDGNGKPVSAKPLPLLPDLRKVGLVGLEAYYSGYPPKASEFLSRRADQHVLVTTGGSDFHGSLKPECLLGEVLVPAECVENLKRLAHRTYR